MQKNQLRQNLTFTLQHKLRYYRARKKLGKCSEGVWIDKNVEFMRFKKNIYIDGDVVIKEGAKLCSCNSSAVIRIGKNTTVGYYNMIFSSEKIEIGDNCLIAPFVYIVDSNHQIHSGTLINQQENTTAPVKIGNDVWIASHVTILKGVTIGDGAVIGAHSLVNKDVPPNSVVGGVPAKQIGERE
ncbi:MAG TPA: acyltransferase [Bacteroidales bacterium]|nr:acyltransferase [Bacteroidales bacterium]